MITLSLTKHEFNTIQNSLIIVNDYINELKNSPLKDINKLQEHQETILKTLTLLSQLS